MTFRWRRRAYLEGKLRSARGALLASGFFRAGDFARAPDEIAPRIGRLVVRYRALLGDASARQTDLAGQLDTVLRRNAELTAALELSGAVPHVREVAWLRFEALERTAHLRRLEERLVFCLRHHGAGAAGRRTLYNPGPAVVDADGYRRYAVHLDVQAPGWQYDDRNRMAPGLAREALRRLAAVAALTGVPMIVADVAEEGR